MQRILHVWKQTYHRQRSILRALFQSDQLMIWLSLLAAILVFALALTVG